VPRRAHGVRLRKHRDQYDRVERADTVALPQVCPKDIGYGLKLTWLQHFPRQLLRGEAEHDQRTTVASSASRLFIQVLANLGLRKDTAAAGSLRCRFLVVFGVLASLEERHSVIVRRGMAACTLSSTPDLPRRQAQA
jgi:hypothetical protein